MKNSEFKTIGNCQCCGRSQAVVGGGLMSKHGYTVKGGWFEGVCSGDRYSPMQVSRVHTDEIVAQVLEDVEGLKQDVEALKTGKKFPSMVEVGSKKYLGNGKWSDNLVPFEEAPSYAQRNGVESAIYRLESRIRAGESFATSMTALVNRVHGTPLVQEKKPEVAAKILSGEKRVSEGGSVLTARYQEAARVYWSRPSTDGRTASGWMGSRAWRALSLVEVETV